ncbi:hypothetical protein HGRIS_014828 [Hohenbuehelia grisea]|uniref:Uncharacterized protein n=1 Tax=Hohenbuehelia grisea TaxID=104357 RepID=A0ABR3IQV0_9AGAR
MTSPEQPPKKPLRSAKTDLARACALTTYYDNNRVKLRAKARERAASRDLKRNVVWRQPGTAKSIESFSPRNRKCVVTGPKWGYSSPQQGLFAQIPRNTEVTPLHTSSAMPKHAICDMVAYSPEKTKRFRELEPPFYLLEHELYLQLYAEEHFFIVRALAQLGVTCYGYNSFDAAHKAYRRRCKAIHSDANHGPIAAVSCHESAISDLLSECLMVALSLRNIESGTGVAEFTSTPTLSAMISSHADAMEELSHGVQQLQPLTLVALEPVSFLLSMDLPELVQALPKVQSGGTLCALLPLWVHRVGICKSQVSRVNGGNSTERFNVYKDTISMALGSTERVLHLTSSLLLQVTRLQVNAVAIRRIVRLESRRLESQVAARKTWYHFLPVAELRSEVNTPGSLHSLHDTLDRADFAALKLTQLLWKVDSEASEARSFTSEALLGQFTSFQSVYIRTKVIFGSMTRILDILKGH